MSDLNNDSERNAVCFLLGDKGTADGKYSNANVTGTTFRRHRFRHHTFQRVVKTGEVGNPAVTLQVCLRDPDVAENWSTFGTLNDAAPLLFFGRTMLPYVRAVRSDSSTVKIKVLVASANDMPDQ